MAPRLTSSSARTSTASFPPDCASSIPPTSTSGSVGRTLVYGPSDLAAVHKVQDGYKLVPLKAFEHVGLTLHATAAQANHHHTHRGHRPDRARVLRRARHRDGTEPTARARSRDPARAEDRRDRARPAPLDRAPARPLLAGLEAAAADGPAKIFAIRAGLVLASEPKHDGWYVAPGRHRQLRHRLRPARSRRRLRHRGEHPGRGASTRSAASTTPARLLNGADKYVIHIPAGDLPARPRTTGRSPPTTRICTWCQPDQPLCNQPVHPRREVQHRRLAGHLRAGVHTGWARVELAAQSVLRTVRGHPPDVRAQGQRAGRHLQLPADHEGGMTPGPPPPTSSGSRSGGGR